MDRREFLQRSAAAALAAQVQTLAQGPPAGAVKKLKVDAYSRHLQWLRTADEVAEAAIEMGYDGVDITVRPYPGHVDPEKVATDLPPFVNTIRKHGLQVNTITCPITDADSPHAEEILQTASSLGINHYWWGTFRYERDKPVMDQLEALKPRVAKLAALNAKYKMTAMYHTYSGNALVGSAIWDLLYVLRNFDPAQVGFHYDIGHMTNAGGNGTWVLNLRAAGPYIAGLSVKDSLLEPVAALPVGGGPFTGSPSTGGRGPGGPGGAPTGGGGGGRGAGGPAGRSANPTPDAWRVRQVPLGQGMDNLPQVAEVLKEIHFSGPVEIQAEYPNGGAENAQDKITLPRAIVLGAMKRDLLTLRAAFAPSGLL
jgi:sugar phosphate isomerase/epimerase